MIDQREQLERSTAHAVALDALSAGIVAADPARLTRERVSVSGSTLTVGESTLSLDEYDEVVVLGGGKAAGVVAAELESILGDRLDGVRIDTTGSRRGDFRHIIREVRWELDARGHEDVDVFVSGGLGPSELRELRDVADGFGVGGYISNADPVDFALDIVAVDGEAVSKRGKLSGIKSVYRTADGGHHVGLRGTDAPADGEELMEPLIRDGTVLDSFDYSLETATEHAEQDTSLVGF